MLRKLEISEIKPVIYEHINQYNTPIKLFFNI